MIPKELEWAVGWEARLAADPITRHDHVASEVMFDFCDDSDHLAEFELAYHQSEDGEYAWSATVVWEGQRFPIGETEPMAPTASAAVYDAIARFFRDYKAEIPTPSERQSEGT